MVIETLTGESEEDKTADMLESNKEEQLKESCTGDNESDSTSDNENSHDDINKREGPKDNDSNNVCSNEESDLSASSSDKCAKVNASSANSSHSSQNSCSDEVRCTESLASSDSNKENVDSNSVSEFEPSDYIVNEKELMNEYDNADLIPLPQLLKIHVTHLVSGFQFGEATKRRAQENMKTARDKKINENRKSGDLAALSDTSLLEQYINLEKPCCSKTVSQPVSEHKTPHSYKRQRLAESKMTPIASDKDFCKGNRRIPECLLCHPECIEVWLFMVYKEEASLKLRNPRLFNDFKSVTPRMRAILLDWLMEVSEVYHLRRVTYYLSVDYFDRFLSIRPDIPKSLLQLVGITCLYIAAKVEEIYPPNLSEFSYVCDGACKAREMISCELLILNSLGWEVVLTTPSDWLNLYMQLHFKSTDVVRASLNMDLNKDFIFPQYSAYQFTRASQLMDLLSLDPGFLKFSYSIIAAAAMYFMYGEKIALTVSGLTWQQLKPCTDYMEAFYNIIKDAPDPRLYSCLGGPHPEELKAANGLLNRINSKPPNENYSFQTHVASMDYFEKATVYRLTKLTRDKALVHSSDNDYSEQVSDSNVQEYSELSAKDEEDVKEDKDTNEIGEDNGSTSLIDDLVAVEELTKNEDGENSDELELSNSEQNLMTLDEIFELILNQEELKDIDE